VTTLLSDTPGLHHVTGIVGDAGAAAGFYGDLLGLRLLRRTVNYEDVLQYHLYFGDATGTPGSVFTVFPDPNADPGRTGRPGYEASPSRSRPARSATGASGSPSGASRLSGRGTASATI